MKVVNYSFNGLLNPVKTGPSLTTVVIILITFVVFVIIKVVRVFF